VKSGYGMNVFYNDIGEIGFKEIIENKVKEIVLKEGKKNSEMNKCERDIILGYSFLMKQKEDEKELLSKVGNSLRFIVREGIFKGKKEEREGLIGLRCICEHHCFFLFFLFFFFFFFLSFFSFYFFIFIGNQEVLRETSVVSEIKEMRKKYNGSVLNP
jgi:hypothetical protein